MVNNSWSAIEEISFNQLPEFEQELITELDFYLQYDLLDNLYYIEEDISGDGSGYERGEELDEGRR